MGLDRSKLEREGDAVVLTGVVDAPADWAYKVTMEVGDWTTILRTATSPEACNFLSNSVGIRKILAMGWWMTKFIALLAVYRLTRVVWIFGKDQPQEAQALRTGSEADLVH
jgi:hypothetical protein